MKISKFRVVKAKSCSRACNKSDIAFQLCKAARVMKFLIQILDYFRTYDVEYTK